MSLKMLGPFHNAPDTFTLRIKDVPSGPAWKFRLHSWGFGEHNRGQLILDLHLPSVGSRTAIRTRPVDLPAFARAKIETQIAEDPVDRIS